MPARDVEDYAQEALLRLVRSMKQQPGDAVPFEARWKRIAERHVRDFRRRSYRRREIPVADPWAAREPLGPAPDAQLEARRALQGAAALPWRLRGVALLAAAGHGLTWIARALALPISAAAERRRAARRALARDDRSPALASAFLGAARPPTGPRLLDRPGHAIPPSLADA
ncbi:uncharacterized protein SOCEGT47_019780 [Sorangium cellulosum]|uniref:RNA polymerase sigma-70 region 2 domain-containing protein n=1 Tax=Sorangium cellulosum TaxID=56 RepID=A0A4P2PY97_SORCE|nr:hypothetical protein [Sorangium cellulosum]AUX21493.1 uncharacterized protein SOCEGT47_019780 [Sorangium cellulosum]